MSENQHVEGQLWDWLQGAVSADEDSQIRGHLRACDRCTHALTAEMETLAIFEQARSDSPLDKAGRARLLGDATTLARFHRYVADIARLADVNESIAEDWLGSIENEDVWTETALEDMHLFHIDGGQKVENAIIGFVRLQPETEFPEHTHVGDELVFVIQGAIIDEHGHEHGPGSLVERTPGSTHSITAKDGHPAIYLSIIQEGLEVFGMRFGPDSPMW